MADSYKFVARFYDLFASDDDLEFFVELAEGSAGDCLELGVGTGRVALELAKDGLDVVGIGPSTGLLDVARGKLVLERAGVRDGLALIEADTQSQELRHTEGVW